MPALKYDDQGSGTPVVLLHGLTFDRTTWRPIIERLDNVRTIAVDLPAHGETGGSPCSVWDVVALVHDLVVEVGAEPPVVVGHSMSGGIASIYASRYPTLGLVTVDQAADIRPFAHFVQSMAPALSGPDFAAAFTPFQESMGIDLLPDAARDLVLTAQRVTPEVVLGYWDEVIRADPEEMQGRIEKAMLDTKCPCLGIFGHELAASDREYIEARVANAEIVEWPGQGHMVHLVDPDRFAERLASFIDYCSAA